MRLVKNKKGQSIVEYALLLGVIIAAILIMQVILKRGFQGGLKDAADKMGDQYSVSNTTIVQNRTLTSKQIIEEEAATTLSGDGISNYVLGGNLEGTIGHGVYVLNRREGGNATTVVDETTDEATGEAFRWSEYESGLPPNNP